ncbi:MAG: B12-binding domain-containing radical SAM protein, partial [Dehalococcoidia bacterium]
MMKCILVDPSRIGVNLVEDEVIRRATEERSAYPPVGLASIAAVLRENGIEVEIIDAKSLNMPPEEVARTVEAEAADLVGVTVFTPNLRSALETCREIKRRCPDTMIVAGGPHIHPLHQEVIQRDFIDFCVRGEGEITMLELAQAISSEGDLSGVRGITFKQGDDIIVTPDRPFISHLDRLPFPARDLLPKELYTTAIGGRWGRFAAVSASRGCPFECHFCQVPQFWPVQRRRSVANVLDELEHIYQEYRIGNVRFTDEILPLNKKWATELCRGMVERGLSEEIFWSCDSRVDIVTEDLLADMQRANCQVIFYGIEFGNQRILDLAGKKTTVAQIHKAIAMTKRAGITPTGNFMVGYP